MTTTTAPAPVRAKAKDAPNKVLLVLLGVVALGALFKFVLAPVLFGGGDDGAPVVRKDKAGSTVSSTNPGAATSIPPAAAAQGDAAVGAADTGADPSLEGTAPEDDLATGDAELQGGGEVEDVATGGRDPFAVPSAVDLTTGGSSGSSSSSG